MDVEFSEADGTNDFAMILTVVVQISVLSIPIASPKILFKTISQDSLNNWMHQNCLGIYVLELSGLY